MYEDYSPLRVQAEDSCRFRVPYLEPDKGSTEEVRINQSNGRGPGICLDDTFDLVNHFMKHIQNVNRFSSLDHA